MKLEKWALIAEIVSGAAVLVTLVFLVVGIQENTDVTRFSVYSGLLDELNENERTRLANPDLRPAWEAYIQETGEAGNSDGPLWGMVALTFRSYEKAFFARKYQIIGEAEWGRFERLICIHDRRAQVADLEFEQILTNEFMDYIDTQCRE